MNTRFFNTRRCCQQILGSARTIGGQEWTVADRLFDIFLSQILLYFWIVSRALFFRFVQIDFLVFETFDTFKFLNFWSFKYVYKVSESKRTWLFKSRRFDYLDFVFRNFRYSKFRDCFTFNSRLVLSIVAAFGFTRFWISRFICIPRNLCFAASREKRRIQIETKCIQIKRHDPNSCKSLSTRRYQSRIELIDFEVLVNCSIFFLRTFQKNQTCKRQLQHPESNRSTSDRHFSFNKAQDHVTEESNIFLRTILVRISRKTVRDESRNRIDRVSYTLPLCVYSRQVAETNNPRQSNLRRELSGSARHSILVAVIPLEQLRILADCFRLSLQLLSMKL